MKPRIPILHWPKRPLHPGCIKPGALMHRVVGSCGLGRVKLTISRHMRPNQIRELLKHLAIIRFPGDPQLRLTAVSSELDCCPDKRSNTDLVSVTKHPQLVSRRLDYYPPCFGQHPPFWVTLPCQIKLGIENHQLPLIGSIQYYQ
jgi:hypothetical protein